jgi:tetratricopeptide (TPR) repeat protein
MRRLSLARKLLGTAGSSLRPQRTTPVVIAERPRSGSSDLKRLYDERTRRARNSQVEMLKRTAEDQRSNNDFAAAMNSLRLAASLAPDNKDIAALLAEVQGQAAVELADAYLQQAQYEEKAGRMAEAAKSYERCANAKPSAFAFERAARCLLEAAGDLKTAADFAKKAVSLAPDSADPRLTLGRVYLAAGMHSSAVGELERASGLAPNDANIRNWLVRARSGKS